MFRILHSLALVFFAIHTATCNLEATFIRCCTLGTNWASQGHKCSHFPTPIDRIPDDQQTSCHSVSEICCIKTHREQQCMDGKIAAKEGHICPGVEKYSGEYHRDCCEACKLGRHVGSTGSGCTFSKFAFGQPWGLVYEECCLDAPHTTLVTFPSNSSNISLVVSTTALPNLCELLPGELCAHICIPTPDSYRCECRPGFSLMSNGKSCQQNSEPERCEVNNPCSHKCTNTPAGLKCSCRPGFKLAPDERSCVDIQQVHNNDLEGKVCPVGYQFNYQSQVCDDVDECLDNESVCGINFECQNTIASYTCVRVMRDECPNGYRLHPSLQICQDINECAEALDHCNRKVQRCVNTNGSYECRDLSKKSPCPAGYKYNTALNTCEDVDECLEDLHGCSSDFEVCRNTEGAYECDNHCRVGFVYSNDQQLCLDINECLSGTDNCPGHQHCINTHGSFRCVGRARAVAACPAGYKPTGDRRNPCQDVNECKEGIHSCDHSIEYCINEVGSFRCELKPLSQTSTNTTTSTTTEASPVRIQCSPGFVFDQKHNTCTDVDECGDRDDLRCADGEECVNTQGSYRCVASPGSNFNCPAGFRYNLRQLRCFDINECEEQIYVCNIESEICINEPGGYRCGKLSEKSMQLSCQQGFIFQLHTNSCVDVDECRDSESVCDSNQNCQNTPGGYECSCKVGFELDRITQACADVNECQVNQHDCLPSQRCDNTIGSFQCIRFTSCGTGYTLNSQSGLCEDDDECLLGTDTCRFQGPIWQCRNTLGSFRCERKRCERNQRLNNAGECYTPGQTTSVNRFSPTPPTTTPVVCPPGFEVGQNNRCVDINECERSNPCRRNQRCFNVVGTHRCINLLICSGGFELNEEGTQCVDIDECATNIHECGRTQICQNLPGGYTCQCPVGYFVNNAKECVDVDECTRYAGRVCALTSTCSNTPGSYRCVCKQGFRQGKDDKTCEDVDECKEMLGICHQNCINNWGSYRCACESGFNLNSDNRTCVDVDECSLSKNRHLCVGICINMPGSYVCQCPPGYRLGSDGRTCQDIDECLFGNTCHNPNEICLNTRGSFRCNTINCPPFYVKDTEHKNRCKRESTYCLITDQACLQMPTSYTFHFMTFVSNLAIPPSGNLDLFTMRGSNSSLVRADFNLEMLNVHAPYGVQKISKNFFSLRNNAYNQAVISVVKSIPGPQEIELQLTMDIHHAGVYGSSAVAKLFIYVSQYEY